VRIPNAVSRNEERRDDLEDYMPHAVTSHKVILMIGISLS
jgi:hypothetical protein